MTTAPGDSSQSQTVSSATLAEMVAQYHHRLLSLEAELKDQARAGSLSTRAFTKRVERLKDVQRTLTELQRHGLTETATRHNGHDIGLPLLDGCTPPELAVCERFLNQRDTQVTAQAEEASRVYRWLTEAVTGRAGWIRTTLRLSKLRTTIAAVERDTNLAAERARATTAHAEKLLQGKGSGGQLLEGLMALFNQLDGTISRVARLRAVVRKEQDKTRAMQAWLTQEERKIRERPSPLSPPTPLSLAKAEAQVAGPKPAFRRAVKRRQVAEEFWQDVLHNGARSPTEREIRRAASALRTGRPKESR